MIKIAIMIISLMCCMGTSAQEYWDGSRPDHRFTIGVRGGVNFSKQNNMGDGADHDFRTSFQLGLETDLNIVRSFSINTGVWFIQKGYKSEYSDYRGSLKTTDNTSYIEIPLLASYRVKLSDASQFQLNVGPYFAFGVSGKQQVKSTFAGQQDYEIDSFDQYDGMKKSDIGVHIGAAVVYNNMYFGASYERGLKNVSNVTGADFQNGTIAINVGYNFNLF